MAIDKVINQKKQNLTNTNFLDISCFPLTNTFYVVCFLSLPLSPSLPLTLSLHAHTFHLFGKIKET